MADSPIPLTLALWKFEVEMTWRSEPVMPPLTPPSSMIELGTGEVPWLERSYHMGIDVMVESSIDLDEVFIRSSTAVVGIARKG
jgi:hypothetical protein